MKRFATLGIISVYVLAAFVAPSSVFAATATEAAPQTKTGAGAIVGGLLGAAAGGVIGHQKGKTTEGVLIGGALGALGGAAVGSQMKTQPASSAPQTAEPAVVTQTTASENPSETQVISGAELPKVTMKQVIYWSEQGLPSEEIIARIKKSASTFVLTQDDIDYLHKQGVSQLVIEAMQGK